jgi:hypothetical protein
MALTADRAVEVSGLTEKIRVLLTASITYFKGSILCFTAAGGLAIKAADTAAYGKLAGVLTKGVVVPASPAVYAEIEVGKVWIPDAGAAQADVGDYCYTTADDTVAMSATNADPCGIVVDVRVGVARLVDFRKGIVKTALA